MSHTSPGKLTRQQLYEKIRQSGGTEQYIYGEMKRLGFWDDNQDMPSPSEQAVAQMQELRKQLTELYKQQTVIKDPEKARKDFHKKRKAEALRRRRETKQQNELARQQRAKDWFDKNQQSITYLGDGLSAGLEQVISNDARLDAQGLPKIAGNMALAQMMGISLNELRFLSFGRKVSNVCHYQSFLIEKKTGGHRRISAPMPRLKRAQYWVLGNILEKLPLHDAAHGFVPGRSIVSNALPHVGRDVVINLDLKDFFPTVTYKRVKGLFNKLGYNEQVATVLALLCTEAEVDEVSLDGQDYFVAKGERHLPQGAPTSPFITNLLCRSLDARLQGAATKLGMAYTRYADDITFSGSRKSAKALQKLLWRTEQIVTEEGFNLHPDKTRIMRNNSKQEVTGIVVNEQLSICRKTLKRFRALLFQIEKDGLDNKTWGAGALIPSIDGYANFVAMVNPEKGIPLQKQIAHIKRKYGYAVKPGKVMALNRKLLRAAAIKGQAPTEDWWQANAPAYPTFKPVDETATKAATQSTPKEQRRRLDQSFPQNALLSTWRIVAIIAVSIAAFIIFELMK